MSLSPLILPGLLSITFRSLTWDDIIQQVIAAGLSAIEWGGDIHVRAGDVELAKTVRRRCEESGILISAFGSYYRAGTNPESFAPVARNRGSVGHEHDPGVGRTSSPPKA